MQQRLRKAVAASILLAPLLAACTTAPQAQTLLATSATSESVERAGTFVIDVAPQPMRCTGVAPRECLQIRRDQNGPWELFYGSIEGFEFQPGYRYRSRIEQTPVENPAADAPSVAWRLVEVLDKQPA
ncbi:DUF4377 domain-containing protein [Nocardia lijiangensis]|uniref:DUF4377 domain-containing protein n=1 Tax=Nocardia lijiangensis TaxID=299618 RepID=UPI0008330E37|nr:DUF4377 domain-containing protein [Nocardia lijiangensis]